MNANRDIAVLTRRAFLQSALAVAAEAAAHPTAFAQIAPPAGVKPTLYLIATAHNDTQWNWTVQATINDFIPKTVRLNEALFEQFPHYTFNYEGVIHYRFCQEYHPELFALIKKRVAEGRWKLAGSWINAVDVNIPSAESLFRQGLYGQQFFRREFGMVSRDLYLPDCFGFPANLPTIARHSGLIAFSTQKLTWGRWIPAPFAVGRWEGVDGSEVVAALRPGAYVTKVHTDPQADPKWQNDFVEAAGRKVDLRYFGTGDTGGAPDVESARRVDAAVAEADGPIRVLNTASDQLAKDLTPAEIAALPHYRGELLLRLHAVGCYTSQAAMKRWNRQNEQLADAAERASVLADWLGGVAYPREHLTENWVRFLWHQFHDDVTGTCIPQAYTFSWNDELIALNGFASALQTAVGAIATGMETRCEGVPLVVYNPLAFQRTDTVEATLHLPEAPPDFEVYDMATNRAVPTQVVAREGNRVTLLFTANVPSVGLKVFDARLRPDGLPRPMAPNVEEHRLENAHLKVTIDANGDISSLYDKAAKREMLASPARIQLLDDPSPNSPAWEILYQTVTTPPRAHLEKPTIRVTEQGPVRMAIEIEREADGSIWTQTLRLTPDSKTLEIVNRVDWKTPRTLVKAAFHTTASSPKAMFDLDCGVIERGNIAPNLWEVPGHQWADLTDASGSHGLAILNDCKYGWDKPADDLLRHTLLHTPYAGQSRRYQGVQDVGKHEFTYALAPHSGDWREGKAPLLAARLNQPLRAFQVPKHRGPLGRELSLLKVSAEPVSVRAVKLAEESDEIVVRVQEWTGKLAENVAISFAAPIAAAREINAVEEAVGPCSVQNGAIRFHLKGFEPRTFAVKLAAPPHKLPRSVSTPLPLPFNLDGISLDSDRKDGGFDDLGRTIPGELLPAKLTSEGITFQLGSSAPGAKNVLVCQGQSLPIPPGINRLYLLACAVGGDTDTEFALEVRDGKRQTTRLRVTNWTRQVGQWYSTLEGRGADGGKQVVRQTEAGTFEGLENLKPAYVKRDTIAWCGTHRHVPEGNEAHVLCYLFKYRLDVPTNAQTLILPNHEAIRILAISAANSTLDETQPASLLYASELESSRSSL